VIELSAEVHKVACEYFALPANDERLVVEVGEGARFVRESSAQIDVLLIDAYDGRSLARSLTEEHFYGAARRLLGEHGVLVMNLWSNDPAFDRNLQRIERAFDHRCLCLPAERPGNVIAIAFAGLPQRLRWTELQAAARDLQGQTGLAFPQLLAGFKQMNLHDADGLELD
jgi:spermidine synthase